MIDCEKVKKLALENGFKLKEQASGNLDLNSYVYDFAEALLKDKQAEIDSLKAQQKLNKPARVGGTVFREGVAWKTVIECAQRHYDYGQRDTQPTPLISPSDAIKLASGELVLVPKDPTFHMKQAAYKQYDTGLTSITEIYQAMIEAAQKNSHEDNACTKYDWSNVPNEVNVITTNKFGKKEYWWMWRGALPKLGQSGWYDEYCGRCIDSFSISEFVGDWKESLEVRPKMTLKKSDGDRHE